MPFPTIEWTRWIAKIVQLREGDGAKRQDRGYRGVGGICLAFVPPDMFEFGAARSGRRLRLGAANEEERGQDERPSV